MQESGERRWFVEAEWITWPLWSCAHSQAHSSDGPDVSATCEVCSSYLNCITINNGRGGISVRGSFPRATLHTLLFATGREQNAIVHEKELVGENSPRRVKCATKHLVSRARSAPLCACNSTVWEAKQSNWNQMRATFAAALHPMCCCNCTSTTVNGAEATTRADVCRKTKV